MDGSPFHAQAAGDTAPMPDAISCVSEIQRMAETPMTTALWPSYGDNVEKPSPVPGRARVRSANPTRAQHLIRYKLFLFQVFWFKDEVVS